MINLVPIIIGVGGKVLEKVIATMIATFLSEKFIIKLAVKILDKVFRSTKNTFDDGIWFGADGFRCELLKTVGAKDKDC